MGYILPVTNYMYNNYQKNMIKDNQSPHYVGKPYKIMLDTKQQELTKKKNPQIQIGHQKKFIFDEKQEAHETKGLYFNKYV